MAAPVKPEPGPARGGWPWATLLAVGLALAVFASRSLEARFVLERPAVQQGEWWRLWTGNWVHFSPSHLLWNLAVLGLAGGWVERLAPARTRWFLAVAPAVIGAAVLFLDPTLLRYGGLSGLAAGMLALLALVQLARPVEDRWFWWSVLALLALKLAVETFAGRALFARFNDASLHPVPLAHLAGVACALVARYAGRRI